MLQVKKSKHYSNILMLSKEGVALATISKKRADWYLNRNLAKEIDPYDQYNRVIQLRFEPKHISTSDIQTQILENKCVVCGTKEDLTLHHVVPSVIRKYFPKQDKSRQHTWCVLVCLKHHEKAEQKNSLVTKDFIKNRNKILESTLSYKKIKAARILKSVLAQAIIDKVPSDVIKRSLKRLKLDSIEEIEKVDMDSLVKEYKEKTKIVRRQTVLQFIKDKGGIDNVKKIFRDLFLSLNPEHLPEGFLFDLN